ncbi:MAG: iron-sulfur cluster assembly protein [Rhizobiaceae bacterium]
MDQTVSDRRLKSRRDEVWACLANVTDPELDESVTELNFVTHADVDLQNHVHIGFRLPTYWCAANFSFLMADDMRQAVQALDWVEGVTVVLGEHMYADKINAGLAHGLSFQETFGAEADGDLDELRQTFLVKAFQRRQVALLNHLTATGLSETRIVALTLGELDQLQVDEEGRRLVDRYLERRGVAGPVRPDLMAFMTSEGAKLASDGLAAYVSALRRVGINAEFNSALCRGLLSVRFDLETPFVPSHKALPVTPDLHSPA